MMSTLTAVLFWAGGFFRISDRENQVFRCPLGNDNDLAVGYKDVHVSTGFKS